MEWKIISLLSFIQIGLYLYFKWRCSQDAKARKGDSERSNHFEVIKFTKQSSDCSSCLSGKECNDSSCIFSIERRLISMLENAQSSIDICMYMFTSRTLGDAVVRAFKKGVRVRVIGEATNSIVEGSLIQDFRKQAIPVRIKKSDNLMHHKFVILDRKTLLTGSCNWTNMSLSGNWDHIIITSEAVLVEKFTCEFDELFDYFSQLHKQ